MSADPILRMSTVPPPFEGDPELEGDAVAAPASGSVFDRLAATVQGKLASDAAATFDVPFYEDEPEEAQIEVTFSTYVTAAKIEEYQRRSKGKPAITLACVIIADLCREIRVGGKLLVEDNDQPATFGSKMLQGQLGAQTAHHAIRVLYQRDSDINSTSNAILAAAGWGEDLKPKDPTNG